MAKYTFQEHVIAPDGRNGVVTGIATYGGQPAGELRYEVDFDDGTPREMFAEAELSEVPASSDAPAAEVAPAATNPKLAAVKPADTTTL